MLAQTTPWIRRALRLSSLGLCLAFATGGCGENRGRKKDSETKNKRAKISPAKDGAEKRTPRGKKTSDKKTADKAAPESVSKPAEQPAAK